MSEIARDCLSFASDALAARGALVEHNSEWSMALCPDDIATELGIPTEIELDPDGSRPGSLAVGFGSPLLEKLIEQEREQSLAACAILKAGEARAAQARSLAERFAVRNGVADFIEVTLGSTVYSVFWLGWSAESDERHDGVLQVGVAEDDLAEPAGNLLKLIDPVTGGPLLEPSELPPAPNPALISGGAARRAAALLEEPLASIRRMLARRKARDHQRIADYFQDLARDAESTRTRSRADAGAMKAKLEHFGRERNAKLGDLDTRFTLKVSLRPVALLRVQVSVARLRMRLRRRKQQREVVLRLPAAAPHLDRPICEGCGHGLARPALCDRALHLLCESCVPEATGRFYCAACDPKQPATDPHQRPMGGAKPR